MQEGRNADLTLEAELPAQGDGPSAPVVEVETKVAAVHVAGRVTVVVLIEGVQEVGSDPEVLGFAKPEILSDTQVCVVEAGTAERVLAEAAIAQRVCLNRAPPSENKRAGGAGRVYSWDEERWVVSVEGESAEVPRDGIKGKDPVRVEVRAVADGAAVPVGIDASKDCEGLARLPGRDS